MAPQEHLAQMDRGWVTQMHWDKLLAWYLICCCSNHSILWHIGFWLPNNLYVAMLVLSVASCSACSMRLMLSYSGTVNRVVRTSWNSTEAWKQCFYVNLAIHSLPEDLGGLMKHLSSIWKITGSNPRWKFYFLFFNIPFDSLCLSNLFCSTCRDTQALKESQGWEGQLEKG